MQSAPSTLRCPGLIVAGRRRPRVSAQGRARGTPCLRGAGHIWLVRQLPCARRVVFLSWRYVSRVMKPAIPAGRGHGALTLPGINDPAALETECGVDFATAVIAIAEFVLANEFAEKQSMQRRIEGFAVPPGENPVEPFHEFICLWLGWSNLRPCPAVYERAGGPCLDRP